MYCSLQQVAAAQVEGEDRSFWLGWKYTEQVLRRLLMKTGAKSSCSLSKKRKKEDLLICLRLAACSPVFIYKADIFLKPCKMWTEGLKRHDVKCDAGIFDGETKKETQRGHPTVTMTQPVKREDVFMRTQKTADTEDEWRKEERSYRTKSKEKLRGSGERRGGN